MVHFKLSPNEEARILKEERERRRKLRIQQVREQSKLNAAKLRQSVNDEKERLLRELAEQLQEQWKREKQLQVQKMEEIYDKSVSCVGEGHRQAADEQVELQRECRTALQHEDWLRAQQRHQAAMQRQSKEVRQRQLQENQHVMSRSANKAAAHRPDRRQAALELERARSAAIASLPPPPHDPLNDIEPVKLRPVKFTDRDAFSSSHYHMADTVVEKATIFEQEFDAKEIAKVEEERLHEIELQKHRADHERVEKARVRHKHAMEKESLKQEYSKLIHELDDLQRADVNRRRQGLEKLPKQIFIAPHRRLEENAEQQLHMERAFEDMYMSATEFTGNLSLALDPHPPPLSPAHSDSLDVTNLQDSDLNGREASGVQPHLRLPSPQVLPATSSHSAMNVITEEMHQGRTSGEPTSHLDSSVQQSSTVRGTGSGGAGTLKKLYERIRSQRDNWAQKSSQETTSGDEEPDASSAAGRFSPQLGTRSDMQQRRSVPGLSEGTLCDGASSMMENSPASLEEGTITSASSYRSLQHVAHGLSRARYSVEESAEKLRQPVMRVMPPPNLSMILREEREKRQALEKQEGEIYDRVLRERQHIEDERRSLEERLSAIELQQKQLEEQDRLLSEALDFPKFGRHQEAANEFESRPLSAAACQSSSYPLLLTRTLPPTNSNATDRIVPLRTADSSQHDLVMKPVYQTSSVRSQRSQAHATDLTSRETVDSLASVPYRSSQSAPYTYNAAFQSGTRSVLPESHSSPDFLPTEQSQVDSSMSESRIRDYQTQLLQRQPDRQKALMEARLHLQERAKQLLGAVPPLILPPSHSNREILTTFSSSTLTGSPDVQSVMPVTRQSTDESNYGLPTAVTAATRPSPQDGLLRAVSQSYSASNYEDAGRSTVSTAYSVQYATPAPGLTSQKTYHHQRYDVRTGEPVDDWNDDRGKIRKSGVQNTVSGSLPAGSDTDVAKDVDVDKLEDDREFVTPEMRIDGRQQLCRPCDESVAQFLSRSPIVSPTSALHVAEKPVSDRFNEDGFNSRVLQAQHDLEERQRRMQEQLAALENDERLLVEEQRRIEEHLGSFRARPGNNRPGSDRGDRLLDDESPRDPRSHSMHNNAEDEDERSSAEQASVLDSNLSQSSTSVVEMSRPTTYSAVPVEPLNSTAIGTHPRSPTSDQHYSTGVEVPVCSTAVISGEQNRFRVSDGRPVQVSASQFRKTLLLDTYASSHSDLLSLLAEGNMPTLSGFTSPNASWNTSYRNMMSENPSLRHDASSYQLLPDLSMNQVETLRTSPAGAEHSEKTPRVQEHYQLLIATSTDDEISEQADVESTGRGSEQAYKRSHSTSVASDDRNDPELRAPGDIQYGRLLSSFSSDSDVEKRSIPSEHNSSTGKQVDQIQPPKRVFISDPVRENSFDERLQFGDAEQAFCRLRQPSVVLLSESNVCEGGDAANVFVNARARVTGSETLPTNSVATDSKKATKLISPAAVSDQDNTSPPAIAPSATDENDKQGNLSHRPRSTAEELHRAESSGSQVISVRPSPSDTPREHRVTSESQPNEALQRAAASRINNGEVFAGDQRDPHSCVENNWGTILMTYRENPKQDAPPHGTTSGTAVAPTSRSVLDRRVLPAEQTLDDDFVTPRFPVSGKKVGGTSGHADVLAHTTPIRRTLPSQHTRDYASLFDSPGDKTWRFSDGATGITDEPDLTLASGATSRDISSLSPDKYSTPGPSTDSSSLLSFEQHERTVMDSSVATPRKWNSLWSEDNFTKKQSVGNNSLVHAEREASPSRIPVLEKPYGSRSGRDAKSGGVRFTLPVADQTTEDLRAVVTEVYESSSSAPVSLRDALAAKRPDFALRSEKRHAEAKEKAIRATVAADQPSENLNRAVATWKKNRDMTGRGSDSDPTDKTPTYVVECSSGDRKLEKKEIKERTKRLYNQLEEVKQRKADDQRRKSYQQNRERRKEYEMKLNKARKSGGAK